MTLSTDVLKIIRAVLDNRTSAWKDLASSLESLGYFGLPSLFPDTPWSWDLRDPDRAHEALTCLLYLIPNAVRGHLACDFARKTFAIWERDYPDDRLPHKLVENGLSVYSGPSSPKLIEISVDTLRGTKHPNILNAARSAQLTCFDGERDTDEFLRKCNDEEFLQYDCADNLVSSSEYSFYAAGGGVTVVPNRRDLTARKRDSIESQIASTAERLASYFTALEPPNRACPQSPASVAERLPA